MFFVKQGLDVFYHVFRTHWIKFFIAFCLLGILWLVSVYIKNTYHRWLYLDTTELSALKEYDQSPHIIGYQKQQILVHHAFIKHLERIESYAKDSNIQLLITQSYRPPKKLLFNTIVKPATRSNHLAGHAIDFNIILENELYHSKKLRRKKLKTLPSNIRIFIEKIRADKKLRWGGDFKRQDPVHIDVPINRRNKARWSSYQQQCANDFINALPKWKTGLGLSQ